MTLNIAQVRDRLAVRFSDVEQVNESVIRFTRKSDDRPFAVYYVDIATELPATPEALTSYQDRIIGKRYFDGPKSLQWSNYLYFVVSDEQLRTSAIRNAKKLIELDRTYARKLIIAEGELDSAFQSPTLAPSEALPDANIQSVWIAKLAEAGLDTAVVSDASLPSRLSLIETSTYYAKQKSTSPAPRIASGNAPFIRSIQLTNFRDFPAQRIFDFGTVNLIVGVNGSGKTSLLEAIELVYCGRNKRNPDAADDYTIAAVFADGSNETATRTRAQKRFRDRNLMWYGQAEVKTNNLFLSFAQFNFLDTDAAVGLADSTAALEDNLSKLLVGPQASKTWREIERMHEAIASRLRELRPLAAQVKAEMAAVEDRVKEVGSIKQESDSILMRLEEMVRRPGWNMPRIDKEAFVGSLVETLSELDALARQATALDWAESPVSSDGIKKYSNYIKILCDKTDADIARLEGFRKDEKRLLDAHRRCQETLKLASEAGRMVDAGLPMRANELRRHEKVVATQSGILAGFDEKVLTVLANSQDGVTVAEFVGTAASASAAMEKALASAKDDHAKFAVLRDRSLRLAQQLREIAAQLIQSSPTPDKCPLCHTYFEPGELSKHIQLGVNEHVEAQAQVLLTQVRQRDEDVRAAVVVERAAAWLVQFCERTNLAMTTSVQTALSQISTARRTLEAAQRRSETLKKELLALESQGLSVAKLDELLGKLRSAGHDLADWTKENVDRLFATVEHERTKASDKLEVQRTNADDLQQTIESTLGVTDSNSQGLRATLSQLRERRTIADSLLEKLDRLFKSLPWPGDKPFSELVVEAVSIRKVAAEYQAAIGTERQAKAVFAESVKRKAELAKQLAELNPRIERFTRAQTTLDSIQREHSLTGAMEAALKRNRAGIETIFGCIHSPAEFSGLGKQLTTLVRKTGGTEAKLSQISTGQRAAFALSIFLAQNLQLRTAPPVLLIDDPIAHVDDLNSLSFLDYLREVVLAGGRQILFTTANEKLAALFERKFDFLGQEKFRRYNLLRETSGIETSPQGVRDAGE